MLYDERAVIGQPIYLLVALIVAAAIIAFFTLSIQQTAMNSQRNQVEHEVDKILIEATNMFEYAEEGTFVTIHVEFPATMRFLVFGGLPTNGTMEPTNLTLNETTSNNYYFVMIDGTLHTFHVNARFSSDNLTQISVFHSGTYDLALDLSHDGEKTYVKIY
jgi:hypothetical protein